MKRRLIWLTLVGLAAVLGGRLALAAAVEVGSSKPAHAVAELPRLGGGEHRAAIVFGAGLTPRGEPTALLRDRIRAAQALLSSGRVDLLLMTGDNSVPGYDEPGAMRRFAVAAGTPPEQVAVDYGGRRTWDSCVRAKRIFGLDHAVVVSNDFHRARTATLCHAAGLQIDGALGTTTAKYAMTKRARWQARELVASWRGVSDAWIHHPAVAVGGRRIDPYNACAVWRSLDPADRGARPSGCGGSSAGSAGSVGSAGSAGSAADASNVGAGSGSNTAGA